MNSHTPLPWYFEDYDPGDRSVGIQPKPPFIYGEQEINPEYSEIVEIAYLNPDPLYQLPKEFWTEEEKVLSLDPESRFRYDFPLGSRACGYPDANGRRIVAAVNATAEYSTGELEKMNFKDIIEDLYLRIEGLEHDKYEYHQENERLKNKADQLAERASQFNEIILNYETNFKERGDIWDEGNQNDE